MMTTEVMPVPNVVPTNGHAHSPDRTPALAGLQCAATVHVLVVDDDVATCQVVKTALAHPDFRIDTVSDPAAVGTQLRGPTEYHLVILDYVLPGLNTEQVLNWLRDHQPDASLVVMTGYPSIEGALNCLRARAFDYLTKPFQISHLREVVFRCLQNKGLMRMTESALREALGQTIRDKRKALGYTLAEMAKRTGVSLGYLSQIELGKNSASIETLYRVSLALNVRIADLFQSIQRS
jgi:CheY-like chemotaxis protein